MEGERRVETYELVEYLERTRRHLALADFADGLGLRWGGRPDDLHALSWPRLRLWEVAYHTFVGSVGELDNLLASDDGVDNFLRELAARGRALGFVPVAQPYDVAVFVLLHRARDAANIRHVLPALGFRRELVLALSAALGVEPEWPTGDTNDAA